MIVQQHVKSTRGSWCAFCGAHCVDGNFGTEATCTPREAGLDPNTLRPEPARREWASEAFDEIGKRLAELKEERAAAMNHVESEPATPAEPAADYDYGCG